MANRVRAGKAGFLYLFYYSFLLLSIAPIRLEPSQKIHVKQRKIVKQKRRANILEEFSRENFEPE